MSEGVPQAMRTLRVHRDIARALTNAGFHIEGAERCSRHLRVRVARDGRTAAITVACSPRNPDDAVTMALTHARRLTRGSRP